MANKYVDVSATYNGDGTLSTPAASAGAAGAWNDFANAFKGTPAYGALANGDVVYVRTNDGTSDLSYTISAVSLTSVTGTNPDSPIRFVFDAGVVWANSGTFTIFLSNSLSSIITIKNYVELEGNFHLNHLYAGATAISGFLFNFERCILRGGKITNGVQTTTARGCKLGVTGTGPVALCTMIGTELVIGNAYNVNSYLPLMTGGYGAVFRFINCTFDVSQGRTDHTLIEIGRYGGGIEIVGGKFIGLTPSHRLYIANQGVYSTNYQITLDGCDLGSVDADTFVRNYTDYAPTSLQAASAEGTISVIANNLNGSFNFAQFNGSVYEYWVSGKNYPTLNAVLPNGTPWSIRVVPAIVHVTSPAKISSINKLYVDSPATKTLTFDLAINENYGTPTKKDFYVELAYFRSDTGALVTETTEAGTGNLDVSTAVWTPNPPVYGAENYDTYKIAITTAYPIKQHSLIRATVVSTRMPTFSTDYYFIDPEFSVT
jgi:hypothetical protein